MEYHVYAEKAKQAQELTDNANDHMAAITIFEELVNSDISDLDKANMCINIAVCCKKMEYNDQALAWYDEGIRYEQPYSRGFVAEHKAAFLAEIRRDTESIAIYEFLYKQPYLLDFDKERIWKNITILKNPRPT